MLCSFGEKKTGSKRYERNTGLTSHRRGTKLCSAGTYFKRCQKEELLLQKVFQKHFKNENLEGRHMKPNVG